MNILPSGVYRDCKCVMVGKQNATTGAVWQKKMFKEKSNLTSGHVLFAEQLSTVFHYLFSFVLSFSLFLGTSQLWMGWQHSCSSSFHSFKTCWLVTMAMFSLSQLSAFVELWHGSIVMYFLHLNLKLSHLNLILFTLPFSLLITPWLYCPFFVTLRHWMIDS